MCKIIGSRIIGFGDSVTEGVGVEPHHNWISLVRDCLSKNTNFAGVEVFNAGVGGNTTREALLRFDSDVAPLLPGTVTVQFGGNDATSNPDRHVDFEEYEQNLLTIAEKVRAKGGIPMFLTCVPLVNEWHASHNDPFFAPYGGCDNLRKIYREITRKVANDLRCRLIELDHSLRRQIDKLGAEAITLPDGVHLTVLGNKIAAQVVLEALDVPFDNCL